MEPNCRRSCGARWRAGSFYILSECGGEKFPKSAFIWITVIFEIIFAMFATANYTRAERNGKGSVKYDGGIIGSLFYNALYYN